METINDQYSKAYDLILQKIEDNYPLKNYTKGSFLNVFKYFYNKRRNKYKLKLIKRLNRQYVRCIK